MDVVVPKVIVARLTYYQFDTIVLVHRRAIGVVDIASLAAVMGTDNFGVFDGKIGNRSRALSTLDSRAGIDVSCCLDASGRAVVIVYENAVVRSPVEPRISCVVAPIYTVQGPVVSRKEYRPEDGLARVARARAAVRPACVCAVRGVRSLLYRDDVCAAIRDGKCRCAGCRSNLAVSQEISVSPNHRTRSNVSGPRANPSVGVRPGAAVVRPGRARTNVVSRREA